MGYIGLDPNAQTVQIADGAVTTAKIAADAITTDKVAPGTIIASDILDGTLTGVKLAANTITTDKLQLSDDWGLVTGSITATDDYGSLT